MKTRKPTPVGTTQASVRNPHDPSAPSAPSRPPDASNTNHLTEPEQKKISKAQARYRKESPEVAKAFMDLWRATKQPSAVPTKCKELIQLAIVLTQHCQPCIKLHVKICVQAGCTRAEIIDAANVALAMGGGAVYEYIGYLIEALDIYLPLSGQKLQNNEV